MDLCQPRQPVARGRPSDGRMMETRSLAAVNARSIKRVRLAYMTRALWYAPLISFLQLFWAALCLDDLVSPLAKATVPSFRLPSRPRLHVLLAVLSPFVCSSSKGVTGGKGFEMSSPVRGEHYPSYPFYSWRGDGLKSAWCTLLLVTTES